MSRLDLTQHLQLQLEENPMLEELLEDELDELEVEIEEPSTEEEITSEETTVGANAVEPDPEIDPPSEDEIQPDFDSRDQAAPHL